MLIVSLDEIKEYLRIDATDEDASVEMIAQSAQEMCMSVARFDDEEEFASAGETAKIAVLFATGYLYEHRDEANHHGLILSLRSLLSDIRRGAHF